jgi:hypothetical protein
MGALDKRLYTLHHAPTDAVSRLEPDRVKLACHGCSWPSVKRLSLPRYCTYNPHPCTVLTAAHNIHNRPPDAPACLAYQRPLMHPYAPGVPSVAEDKEEQCRREVCLCVSLSVCLSPCLCVCAFVCVCEVTHYVPSRRAIAARGVANVLLMCC